MSSLWISDYEWRTVFEDNDGYQPHPLGALRRGDPFIVIKFDFKGTSDAWVMALTPYGVGWMYMYPQEDIEVETCV